MGQRLMNYDAIKNNNRGIAASKHHDELGLIFRITSLLSSVKFPSLLGLSGFLGLFKLQNY